MRYYVTADVHGYFDELKKALAEQGYFTDTEPHKLVICGDLYDRGKQASALQAFILDLMEKEEIILIRGNHEDLALDLLQGWYDGSYLKYHHHSNGTIDTVCQLTGATLDNLRYRPEVVEKRLAVNPYIQEIIPSMKDYYETAHYIFVHGWIPCTAIKLSPEHTEYVSIPDWRNADAALWSKARWINGMAAAHAGITEAGKTIVCGHWHCSFGHVKYEGKGGEFDNDPDFSPYCAKGILAIDACTAVSGKVNCIVIDD